MLHILIETDLQTQSKDFLCLFPKVTVMRTFNNIFLSISIAIFSISGSGFSQAESPRAKPAFDTKAMIVSAERNATLAGYEILDQGGNAADAAAALGFALAVTYPSAGNIGGGGFCVIRTSDGRVQAIDYREKAPAASERDMFRGPDGKADPELSQRSLLASGVPGSVAGLITLWEKFGSGNITLQQLLAPAIRLAGDGFPVYHELSTGLASDRDWLTGHAGTKAAFYPGGNPPETGYVLKQPRLAATLKQIAAHGRDGFYGGWVADSLVSFMKRGGGIITHEDLQNYSPEFRQPVRIEDGENVLYSMSPPSSGGVVVGQVLKLLKNYKLDTCSHNDAAYINALTECLRLAFADRNQHLGDPGFIDIPLETMLSDKYLANRAKLLPPSGKAGNSEVTGAGKPESFETTHYSVVDSKGNAVAITTTLNGSFGMGAVVPGVGFFLNNEMDDFAALPGLPNMFGLVQGEQNKVEPGKRMLSSMTPTIVTRRNASGGEELFMTIGAAGGPRIITAVLQIYLNATRFGMNVRSAVDAPRIHHQHLPDLLYYEPLTLSSETAEALKDMGYNLELTGHIARAAAIMYGGTGNLTGWCDGNAAGAGR